MIAPLQPPPGRAAGGIADRLRRAREERGLSLAQLSVKTRIPARHLETIEAGRVAELPGGFIGKSFVRQYAEAVGMDAEQALRELIAQTGIDMEVPFEERKISPFTPESIQRFHAKVWRQVGIGAAALLVLILTLAYFLTRPRQEAATPPPAPRPLPAYLEPGPPAGNSQQTDISATNSPDSRGNSSASSSGATAPGNRPAPPARRIPPRGADNAEPSVLPAPSLAGPISEEPAAPAPDVGR